MYRDRIRIWRLVATTRNYTRAWYRVEAGAVLRSAPAGSAADTGAVRHTRRDTDSSERADCWSETEWFSCRRVHGVCGLLWPFFNIEH